jgi:hypothetical protein
VGYVDATCSVLKEVRKRIETKWATVVDQATSIEQLLLMNPLAFASTDTSKLTCAQVQDYVKTHGQTLLTTGIESGNYSFNYADCGGTVPGFACTMDEAYCYVGWWCDYDYPVAVNPNVHDQGTNSCPARRR